MPCRSGDVGDAMRFLESLGWRFGLDYDDELIVTAPENQTTDDLKEAIERQPEGVVTKLQSRRRQTLQVFADGPLHGQPYDDSGWPMLLRVDERVVRVETPLLQHLARARWACYRIGGDGRAWYVGEATSRKKGKALVLKVEEARARQKVVGSGE